MRIKVEFEIELPDVPLTDDQIEEWVRFELGDNGGRSTDTPLDHVSADPVFGTFEWERL